MNKGQLMDTTLYIYIYIYTKKERKKERANKKDIQLNDTNTGNKNLIPNNITNTTVTPPHYPHHYLVRVQPNPSAQRLLTADL
jgi:hypothetical protein